MILCLCACYCTSFCLSRKPCSFHVLFLYMLNTLHVHRSVKQQQTKLFTMHTHRHVNTMYVSGFGNVLNYLSEMFLRDQSLSKEGRFSVRWPLGQSLNGFIVLMLMDFKLFS